MFYGTRQLKCHVTSITHDRKLSSLLTHGGGFESLLKLS